MAVVFGLLPKFILFLTLIVKCDSYLCPRIINVMCLVMTIIIAIGLVVGFISYLLGYDQSWGE